MLPGWNGRAREFARLERHLLAHGWPRESLRILQFRDIRGSNIEHADEIAEAVDALGRHCEDGRVDIVAHSMGGLATRWFMTHGPAPTPVRRAIFIGTPHAGTWLAWAAWGAGGPEMRPGSEFLRRLDHAGIPDHVDVFTIRTRLETRVWPARHAILAGAQDYCVRTSTHPGLLRSRSVMQRVVEYLAAEG